MTTSYPSCFSSQITQDPQLAPYTDLNTETGAEVYFTEDEVISYLKNENSTLSLEKKVDLLRDIAKQPTCNSHKIFSSSAKGLFSKGTFHLDPRAEAFGFSLDYRKGVPALTIPGYQPLKDGSTSHQRVFKAILDDNSVGYFTQISWNDETHTLAAKIEYAGGRSEESTYQVILVTDDVFSSGADNRDIIKIKEKNPEGKTYTFNMPYVPKTIPARLSKIQRTYDLVPLRLEEPSTLVWGDTRISLQMPPYLSLKVEAGKILVITDRQGLPIQPQPTNSRNRSFEPLERQSSQAIMLYKKSGDDDGYGYRFEGETYYTNAFNCVGYSLYCRTSGRYYYSTFERDLQGLISHIALSILREDCLNRGKRNIQIKGVTVNAYGPNREGNYLLTSSSGKSNLFYNPTLETVIPGERWNEDYNYSSPIFTPATIDNGAIVKSDDGTLRFKVTTLTSNPYDGSVVTKIFNITLSSNGTYAARENG